MLAAIEPLLDPRRLHESLYAGLQRAHTLDAAVLVSVSASLPATDPLAVFAAAAGNDKERLYWARPAHAIALAGIGVAQAVETDVAGSAAAWRALLHGALVEGAHGELAGPLLMGGFAFDPQRPATALWSGFPAGRLVLPRLTVAAVDGAATLTLNAVLRPGADPAAEADSLIRLFDTVIHHGATETWRSSDVNSLRASVFPGCNSTEILRRDELCPREEWEGLVAAVAQACASGYVEKVVLARALRLYAHGPIDPVMVLARLRDAYPSAYVFAVGHGERCFVGATPERLVRLSDGTVDVAGLAGSAPRGGTAEEDAYLGNALLGSVKDRAEHAVVVREIRDGLADLCVDLHVPSAPRLLRLHNVQHLYTPVEARVQPGVCVLNLVARLHPTPAVGGYPRETALDYIRTHEGLDRGWYAGPIGWVNRHGEGEFAVALRSALLGRARVGATATLFAGCGIVAASQPADEYAETCLKLRPMLAALGAPEDGA